MKDILIACLKEAYSAVAKTAPSKLGTRKFISLTNNDVTPSNLLTFMEENNIPKEADFDGQDNGFDAWDDIGLSWMVYSPTTEKEKEFFISKRFDSKAFSLITKALINAGYKRNPSYIVSLPKKALYKALYKAYKEDNIDELVAYYNNLYTKE